MQYGLDPSLPQTQLTAEAGQFLSSLAVPWGLPGRPWIAVPGPASHAPRLAACPPSHKSVGDLVINVRHTIARRRRHTISTSKTALTEVVPKQLRKKQGAVRVLS